MHCWLRLIVPCVIALTSATSSATVFNLSCSVGGVQTNACISDGASGSISFDFDVPLDGTPFTSAATYSLSVLGHSYVANVTQFVDRSGKLYAPTYSFSKSFLGQYTLTTAGPGSPRLSDSDYYAYIERGNDEIIRAASFSGSGYIGVSVERFTGSDYVSYTLDNSSVAPTRLQLARMSESTYPSDRVNVIDDFKSERDVVGPDGFSAQVFRKGNQIVLAIRGTLQDGSKIELANSSSNTSFLSDIATTTLKSEVSQAASLLARLKEQCQSCEIYLTGHSLGGAVAQILGQKTGLPTNAFNAPGAGKLTEQLATLPAVQHLSDVQFTNSGSNENLRSYGDLISLAGQAIGNQFTISTGFDGKVNSSGPQLFFYDTHYIDTVVSALSDHLNVSTGVVGPGLTAADRFISGVALGNGAVRFDRMITSGEYWSLDPEPSSIYQFVEDDGSPLITSIAFPGLRLADHFFISYIVNGSWSNDILLNSGNFFIFDGGTLGIRYGALSVLGQAVTLPADYAPVLTFASNGRMRATLTLQNVSSPVPETGTWAMLICSISLIGLMLRRRPNQWFANEGTCME